MNWIDSIRRQLRIATRPNRNARRGLQPRLSLTRLEDRTVPTVDTWTGASSNLWSDNGNWLDNTAPTAGEDLVFPASATNKTSVYDSGLGVSSFGSIDIQSSGYDIGASFAGSLTLTGGISATYGSSISNFDIDFDPGNGAVSVGAGATLEIGGAISGTNGLAVSSGGTLQLGGTAPNTYTGATTVANATTLVLDKTSATAVPGDLTISAGGTVQLAQSDQIADASGVTAGAGATLNLNNFSDTIGTLDLTGATVTTGTGTLTLGGDVTTNSDTSTSVISGNLDLGGATRTFTVGNNSNLDPDLSITANISGTGAGLIKAGANSQLLLSGNNTYDGITTITAGAIEIASDNALGSSSAGTVVNSGFSLALLGGITVPEPITISGAGFGGLGAVFNGSGNNTISGAITLGANSTIGSLSGTLTFSGVISDGASSFALTKVCAGTVALTSANTYDGGTTITNGLNGGGALAISDGSALGTGLVTVASGGSLDLSGGITLANTINLDGIPATNRSKINSVSGNNTIQGDIGITGANNVAFDVAGGTTLTVAGVISGSRDFDKNNTGTLVLTGTNTNTGNVNVGDGTLIVNGSLATSNSVFVDGVLGGSGTVSAVTLSGIGTLAPGASPGTIATGVLTFQSGSTYSVELNGTTAGTQYDQADVTGTVALAGTTLSLSLGYSPAIGDTFTIIANDGSDAVSGTFNGLAEGATLTIGTATLAISYVGGDGNDIVLTVTDVTYTWTGADNSGREWSIGGNWVGNVAPTAGARLIFPNNPVRTESVNDFASGTSFYSVTIAGSGYDIYGNALTITNGITATFTAGNSAFGLDTVLTATEAVAVATGGTLDLTGAVSGTGFGVTKAGGGTLRYSGAGANTYTGATTVNAGRLELNKTAGVNAFAGNLVVGDSSGSGDAVALLAPNQIPDAATVAVNEGAALDLGTFLEAFTALTAQAGTVTIGAGAVLTLSSSLTTTVSVSHAPSVIQGAGALDLGGNATFAMVMAHDTFNNGTINVDAQISTPIQNGGIVKSGSGILGLSGANTYASATSVTDGAIQVQSASALGTTAGGTTVASGASVYFNGTLSVAENISIAGTGFISSGALTTVFGSAALSGAVTLTDNSQIGAAGAATLTLNGVIDNTGSSYGLSVLNAPDGRTVLGGSNQFDGAVSVLSGFLRAASANAFGDPVSSSSVTVGAGASLELAGGVTIPATKSVTATGVAVASSSKIINVAGANSVAGTIAFTGVTNESFDVAGGTTLTVTGVISGSVDVDKNGTGTLVLTGTNANTGAVNVGAGTLIVNGSLATSAAVLVDGVLGGSGTVPAVTLSGTGTLAPGASPGTIATGNLTFQSGSAYSIELNGTTAGTQYDQTTVTGTVDLTGATLTGTLGFAPAIGDTFTIVANDGADAVTGTFTGLSAGATVTIGGTPFLISYTGGDGNDVTLTAGPEPVLSVTGASAAEGNSGTVALTFTVTLPAASSQTVTVAYTTTDGTATAGTDYAAASGTLTFAPGVTSQTVTVLVNGDTTVEADESFFVTLSAPVNATIGAGTGTGTVTNDDASATRVVLGAVGGTVQQIDPATGLPGASVPAYTGFTGEVRVSSGDVDGDGTADLITGAGTGAMGGHVKVFDGTTGAERYSFLAFDGFAGGVFVASGDVNGDGFADIVAAADAGAAPHVKVFSGKDGSLMMSFLAYDAGFKGGVRVAVGDVDGDGFADIVTGNGAGAPANVKVFSGQSGGLLASLLPYAGFNGGVYVGAGDVDGDGFADIVTGSGAGAPGGHVKVFSGRDFALEDSFLAFDRTFTGGVRVGTGQVNGGTAVLAGSGAGARGHFKAFGPGHQELLSLFSAGFDQSGVYVA